MGKNNLNGLTQKRWFYIILPLFIGSVIAYLDRVNIAYAALTMNQELGFSASIYGMGAGIFFAGYVLFEIPGALIAERWSPRIWLARIMITWGIISVLMAFIRTPWQFYLVRFLLGAAEASFYPVAYASVIPRWYTPEERPHAIALMLASLQISAMIGSPMAGWILGFTVKGLHGWQLLFIIEAIPACLFGVLLLFWLVDWPEQAVWLSANEKRHLIDSFARETKAKNNIKRYTVMQALCSGRVVKLCCIYFMWITGFWGYNYWLPTVLKEASGWSVMTIGWMIVIPMTLALLGMVVVGYSSSRHNEKRWHGANIFICTDDGSKGYKGFATKLAEEFINKNDYNSVITCGPEVMMKKLFDIFKRNDFQASLERYMKCGFGLCGQCCVGEGLRVCKEGPVFNRAKLKKIKDFGIYKRDASGRKIKL